MLSDTEKTDSVETEAALDGIYVIRSAVKDGLSAEDTVRACKQLADVEQAFRCIKTVDLQVRPIYHRLSDRVRAHVFLAMLAYHVERHLRKDLAPLLFEEEDMLAARAGRDPVAPAAKTDAAASKAQAAQNPEGDPVHSFHSLMAHLGSLRRDTCRYTLQEDLPTFTKVTRATPLQRRVFELTHTHL